MKELTEVITDFQKEVEEQFIIPGKIELDAINLRGNWLTFNGPLDSPMRQNLAD